MSSATTRSDGRGPGSSARSTTTSRRRRRTSPLSWTRRWTSCAGSRSRATTSTRRSTSTPSRSRSQQLGRQCGAVVALDPRTGKVKVMASSPSFDPNLAETQFDKIEQIGGNCRSPAPLLNRASAGLFVPGSTFKVVTAAAALESRKFSARVVVRRPGLLHRLRQAREQLRHEQPVRAARPRERPRELRQLRVLQHRQGARREAHPRHGEELRVLRAAAARDARPTSGGRAGCTTTAVSTIRDRTRTSTRAAWRSARNGCS